MSSKSKRTPGDVLKIRLRDGMHAYAHVSVFDPLVVFYNYYGTENLALSEIAKLPVIFIIWVHKDAIESGNWEIVGNIHTQNLDINPEFFKQDAITGRLYIYHDDLVHTNYERPASFSEAKDLERAAVWDKNHVEDRLDAYFSGKKSEWIRPIDFDALPPEQRV